MIQFKKMLYSKFVLLLLLFSTTTTKSFVQDDERTTRDIGNVRESRLSLDRQLENSQNLPIRNADLDRRINQKDKVVERVYDRRSFRTGTIERNSDIRDVNNNQRETLNDRQHIRDTTRNVIVKGTRHINNEREDRRISPNDRRQTRDRRSREMHDDQQMRNRQQARQITNRRVMDTRSEPSSTRNIRRIYEDKMSQDMSRRQLAERARNNRERRNLDKHRVSTRSMERRVNERRDIDENNKSNIRSANNGDRRTSERRNSIDQIFAQTLEDQSNESERRQTNRRLAIRSTRIDNNRQYAEVAGRRVNFISREDRIGTPKSRREATRILDRMERSDERSGVSREIRGNSIERRVRAQDRNSVTTRDTRTPYLMRSTENLGRRVSERRGLDQVDRLTNIRSAERRERTNEFRRNSFIQDQPTSRDRSVTRENRERRNISNDQLVERRDIRISTSNRRHMAHVPEASRSDSTRNIRDSAGRGVRDHPTNSLTDRTSSSRKIVADRYDPLVSDSRRYFEKLVSERITRKSERDSTTTTSLLKNVDYAPFVSSLWVDVLKAGLAAFLIGQILANSSKTKKYGFSDSIISMMKSVKQKVE